MKNLLEFDYLKELENSVETIIPDDYYMIARLDGNNFHNFTKGMLRPFDPTLRESMADVTRLLMTQFQATYGFTQSDEISLIWKPRKMRNRDEWAEHPRSGRILKLSTLMSSYCTLEFYKLIHHYGNMNQYNGFDCRMYGGDEVVALDSLRFRFIDAASNAYQSVAQFLWSPKRLHKMSVQDIKQAIKDENIDVWQAYGNEAMLGVFFAREEVVTPSETNFTLGGVEMKMLQPAGRTTINRYDGAEMMKRIKNGQL